MTEQANSGLARAEDLFKDIVWDNGVEAALASLYASAPFLKVWPFGYITRHITLMFTDKLFSFFRLVLDLKAISFLNEKHKREYDREAVKLKIIAQDKGIDSEEFKKARNDAKAALSSFIRFGQ